MGITVSYEELHPYPRSLWQEGVFLGTRQLKCAWADRVSLLTQLDTPPNNVWPYDDGPDDALLFKVQTDSLGKQTGEVGTEASYDYAVLTCWYHNQGPILHNNTELYTERIVEASDVEPLPYEDLRWLTNTGVPLRYPDERPLLRVYGMVYELIMHRIVTIPSWVYLRTRRVNPISYECFRLPYVFPPQTMLYQPARIVTTATLYGQQTYDVIVRYLIHPSWADYHPDTNPTVGWNTFWQVSSANYKPIYYYNGDRYIQYPTWPI